MSARLEKHVPFGVRAHQTLVKRRRDISVLIILIRPHIHLAALLILVALLQRLAQIRIRTQIQRRLSFLVLQIQIRPVPGQEACDARRRLLVAPLRAQPHQELADVLDVVELAQLRQSVMAEGFVKGSVAVFIRYVQIGAFSDEKLEDED